MNRFAKKFRVLGSLCVLLNLIAFFQPVTMRIQENYADLTWSQLDYVKGTIVESFSGSKGEASEVVSVSILWVMGLIVLPLLLSLAAGIWGLIGSYVQRVSSILEFFVLFLYIGLAASIGSFWPKAAVGQAYSRGISCTLALIFSGLGAIFAVLSLIATPRKAKMPKGGIPQVEEIKQEQVESMYQIMNVTAEEQQLAQTGPEHGVLVGRTGLYAGAEIPMTDGEYIRLGRQADNHLIFEGQLNVSRNHCQIKWDAARQKYIFRDYSSNGSFVNGAEDCMPQNLDLELAPGTVIAIGDENNTFYLK